MKKIGQQDRSTLRLSRTQLALARQYAEKPSGPLFGELNVLVHGCAFAPAPEVWSLYDKVDGAEYWVSDLGNFAVWREAPARIWDWRKYPQAVLYVDGKKAGRDIHVLVARAFCTWKPGDNVVRHLNSDPHTNHANNLMPGTQVENMEDLRDKALGRVRTIAAPATEVWRLSDEYAGVRISNLGNVNLGWWLAFNTHGYVLKRGPRAGTKKHIGVTIKANEKACTIRLHRIVWEAFRGKIPNGAYVRHLNDDPHDNRLVNLAIGTALENAADRDRNSHQRYGDDHGGTKYSDAQRRHLIDLTKAGIPVAKAANLSGIARCSAYRIVNRYKAGLRFTK
jgi:hypothetical protein